MSTLADRGCVPQSDAAHDVLVAPAPVFVRLW